MALGCAQYLSGFYRALLQLYRLDLPSGNQSWLENPRFEWRVLAWKMTDFYGPFSSTTFLMTTRVCRLSAKKSSLGGFFDTTHPGMGHIRKPEMLVIFEPFSDVEIAVVAG